MERQLEKFGVQTHPHGCSYIQYGEFRYMYQKLCEAKNFLSKKTWADILLEEVYEALAEDNVHNIEEELIQVIAVVFNMIESLDRSNKPIIFDIL